MTAINPWKKSIAPMIISRRAAKPIQPLQALGEATCTSLSC
jgi:hypothetical protein